MATMTHDESRSRSTSRLASGLGARPGVRGASASRIVARGLLDAGWTAGAAVDCPDRDRGRSRCWCRRTSRCAGAGQLLRGNAVVWSVTLRPGRGGRLPARHFYAVAHMQVGVALLIEYTAPVAVIMLALAPARRAPGRSLIGAGRGGALGLVLVLDLLSGADISLVGVLWALGAMVGAATYFVISAEEGNGLPPMPWPPAACSSARRWSSPAWSACVADERHHRHGRVRRHRPPPGGCRCSRSASSPRLWRTRGIAAGRRLGSRLASFVALSEVVASLVFAWLLLGELPRPVQLLGGLADPGRRGRWSSSTSGHRGTCTRKTRTSAQEHAPRRARTCSTPRRGGVVSVRPGDG